MKRDTTIHFIKNYLKMFKHTLQEVGARGVLKVIILFSILTLLLFSYTLGIKYSMHRNEVNLQQTVETNGVNVPGHYIGKFTISHYCSCPICTNTPKGSRTATGHIPREGRTVAVDKNIIPLHSVIYVEGLGTFVAEDVGGAVKGNHLDIYIDDHQRALKLGTLKGATPKVYILE